MSCASFLFFFFKAENRKLPSDSVTLLKVCACEVQSAAGREAGAR